MGPADAFSMAGSLPGRVADLSFKQTVPACVTGQRVRTRGIKAQGRALRFGATESGGVGSAWPAAPTRSDQPGATGLTQRGCTPRFPTDPAASHSNPTAMVGACAGRDPANCLNWRGVMVASRRFFGGGQMDLCHGWPA